MAALAPDEVSFGRSTVTGAVGEVAIEVRMVHFECARSAALSSVVSEGQEGWSWMSVSRSLSLMPPQGRAESQWVLS